jgi:hypothetical protein
MEYHGDMTTYDYDPVQEAADAYWYGNDGVDWYCNHDVPNGCRDCAWLRQEDQMLAAMTSDERAAYWAAIDDREDEFLF